MANLIGNTNNSFIFLQDVHKDPSIHRYRHFQNKENKHKTIRYFILKQDTPTRNFTDKEDKNKPDFVLLNG